MMNQARRIFVGSLAAVTVGLWGGHALADQTSHPDSSPNGTWVKLGQLSASKEAEHDRLTVTGHNDDFRKLKFRVSNAPLNMHRVIVTFDSGAPQQLEVKESIPKGGETREIDLNGGKRSLRTIEFWYDTRGGQNGKAEVTVFARR
jgi:hypothetical protein